MLFSYIYFHSSPCYFSQCIVLYIRRHAPWNDTQLTNLPSLEMSACFMHEEQQPRCKLEILFLTTTGYSLQPATCHLQPATCELRPATDFTNLHAELFFASRIKWARAECTFGLSLREAQSERATGAKRAWLQMSVTSAMCSQMWGSNCVTTCSKMPECIL